MSFAKSANAQHGLVLTPDGNGIEDTFGPESFSITNWDSFVIFDRWGNIVFEGDEENSDWDGTSNGEKCKEGTYVWQLIVISEENGEEQKHHGHFTLLW